MCVTLLTAAPSTQAPCRPVHRGQSHRIPGPVVRLVFLTTVALASGTQAVDVRMKSGVVLSGEQLADSGTFYVVRTSTSEVTVFKEVVDTILPTPAITSSPATPVSTAEAPITAGQRSGTRLSVADSLRGLFEKSQPNRTFAKVQTSPSGAVRARYYISSADRLKHGVCQTFHANGALRSSGEYRSGSPVGQWFELDTTGNVVHRGPWRTDPFSTLPSVTPTAVAEVRAPGAESPLPRNEVDRASARIERRGLFYYQGETRLRTHADFGTAMGSCPEASRQYGGGVAMAVVGRLLASVGGACLGWNIAQSFAHTTGYVPALWVVGGVGAGTGLALGIASGQMAKGAVRTYNESIASGTPEGALSLRFSGNAVSMTLEF